MEDIQVYIDLLKSGKTILYPSDTIWALGCDATNEEACQKIMQLKNRTEGNSFIILVDGWHMVERYIPEFHEVCYELGDLAEKPLTIVYPNARNIAPSALAADGSIGIRITNDPTCVKLIKGMRKPLISTSANFSGKPSPQSYAEISDKIKANVDVIIEERLKEQMTTPSQIIKVDIDGTFKIIRA
jgi:L-threonylcarbamoyladenylate synthase